MGDTPGGTAAVPDAQEVLRASLHALLTSAQRVTSARGVALGVPTGTGTGVSVVQAVGGSDLVPGSTIDAGAVPGLRVLALPPVAAGYPRPNAVLLVLRGMVNLDEADPGAALPAALLALSAVVQAAQIQRRAAKGVTAAAASPSPAGAPSPAPAPPDPDSILGRVARRVCELIGADLASVATKDATGTLVWRALAGYRSLLLHSGPVPPEARLVHAVAESGCAEVVMQIQHNAETRSMYPLLEREGVETAAGTPLCREDAVVGVLVVAWRTPHEVSADEERLLVSLADQVTAAMAQGQLAEESGRQRAFLERLIQHVPAGIIAFTVPDLRVSEVNPFYLQFLDEPFRSGARDLHGLPVTEFIPQVAESGLLDLFRRVATTGEPVTISEFEFTGFERGITYWDWSMVSLHDMEGGPVTGLLLLVAERTEAVLARRRLAAALAGARAQAAELDAVIQQMAEGVAITDPSGRLIKINAAGEALLGRGIVPLEPGGNYAEGYEIYDREGRPFDPARLPLERAAHGETVTGQDMVVHRPGGEECILSVSAAPLHGEAGAIQGAVAVFHDVTKAREVERLKDEFLSIVSHELRTPLAAILGYSDILLRKLSGPLTEKQEQTIESVRSNAKRLLGLINDLLDVSKLEAQGITLSPEPLLLQHAIPKAQGWVQVLATARGVSLQHQVPVTLPAVWADEARLHQIITNLLSNAIKFTPTGGAVMVRAQLSTLPADAPAEQAESALAPTEGPSVLITVQDTGLGMAPDQLERIWDRFYQAESTSSRRFGGTGLGLSIVKHLVALHGGEVWATSGGPDKGSTFSFRLPLVSSDSRPRTRAPEEPASEVPSDAPPAEPSAPGRPLVLIIEDHHDLSTVMRTMLDAAGYQVATAGDGSSGLEAAHRLQPAVIMLDVVLPQASGWEVLQQLKSEPTTTKIPVVMVSILEHQRLGLLLGATEYLVKPFDQERLVATLRRLVGPTPRQPRVLIVDDAPALRDTLSTLLREDGYLVDTANDGVLALEQLRVAPPDLVLLDLVMPGMDGFAVLEWIRAHGDPAIHNLPVVMVTAKDLTPEEHARLAAATEELIPVAGMSIGELLRVVKETLEKLHVTAHDDHPGATR